MELRPLVSGTMIMFLTGCSGIQPNTISTPTDGIEMDNHSFSLQLPKALSHKYVRPDKSTAYTTYDAPTTKYLSSDFSIAIYPPESLQSSLCSPSLIGTSKTQSLFDNSTMWGRVDAWDSFMPEFFDGEPKCKPGVIAWINTGTEEGQRKLSPETHTVYALCSEHNGRAVVICIDQVTDNPALAEEIFNTFRWTE